MPYGNDCGPVDPDELEKFLRGETMGIPTEPKPAPPEVPEYCRGCQNPDRHHLFRPPCTLAAPPEVPARSVLAALAEKLNTIGHCTGCNDLRCADCELRRQTAKDVPAPDECWLFVGKDGNAIAGRCSTTEKTEAEKTEAWQVAHGREFHVVRYVRAREGR